MDDLLAHRARVTFEAVLEPIADDPRRARITPIASNRICGCDHALVIAKDQIVDTEPTGQTIACCGKLHTVVRVALAHDARRSAHEIVASMIARAQDSASARRSDLCYR